MGGGYQTTSASTGAQFLLMLGGPGSGKSTQGTRLAKRLHIPHISSGALFRSAGGDVEARIREGQLMPDDVAITVVEKRLEQPDARRGAVLDGFPRTVSQADAFDTWLRRHGGIMRAVIYLETTRDTMIERVVDRGGMSQRSDDRPDVADRRAQIFASELPALLDHYERQALVRRVDGSRSIDDVQSQIASALCLNDCR
jgi:adenylate kinase